MRLFTLSTEFDTALASSTKTEYRRMLTKAEVEFGDMPIAALDDPRVVSEFMNWREKVARASGEREADNRLSAISAMLTWAIERGHITANHLRGFKRLYHADRSESFGYPSIRCVHGGGADRDAAGDDPRVAYRTAAGRSIALPWSAYDGARSRYAKVKRNAVITWSPCHRSLHCGVAPNARRHGTHLAADLDHEDRTII